jgi:arginine-tRNA-protein transferase
MEAGPSFSHFPAVPPPVAIPLSVQPERTCPYLPDRVESCRAFAASRMPPEVYHDFMDAGFRRSGLVVYQPVCRSCRACQSIRVPVERFRANHSQRRCWRKNSDLVVTAGLPSVTEEKYELFVRYQTQWHAGTMATEPDAFAAFLYESPTDTLEFTYRDAAGKLLAVGICDICTRSLSSVYFYFDPNAAKRSMGTYGALTEVAFAQSKAIPYYYLGYFIKGCAAMEYKANFRPYELLQADGTWAMDNAAQRGE